MIYLASPYSHPDPAVVAERIKVFCKIDSMICKEGKGEIVTVSPLAKHLLFVNGSDLPTDWNFWKGYSTTLMTKCSQLWVIKSEGWDTSTGVAAEIDLATRLHLPIRYIDPETLEL